MRHSYGPPIYSEAAAQLRQDFQNVTVTWTEDDAGCLTLDVRLDPVSPPPVKITLGGKELHNDHPEEDEWKRRAETKKPELQRYARRRAVLQDLTSKVKPNASRDEIIEAALDAAERVTTERAGITAEPEHT